MSEEEFRTLNTGDKVRVARPESGKYNYREMDNLIGEVVTIREFSGSKSFAYIYEDEGTCHIDGHKYGGWFWFPFYLERYEEEIELKNADQIDVLLFG